MAAKIDYSIHVRAQSIGRRNVKRHWSAPLPCAFVCFVFFVGLSVVVVVVVVVVVRFLIVSLLFPSLPERNRIRPQNHDTRQSISFTLFFFVWFFCYFFSGFQRMKRNRFGSKKKRWPYRFFFEKIRRKQIQNGGTDRKKKSGKKSLLCRSFRQSRLVSFKIKNKKKKSKSTSSVALMAFQTGNFRLFLPVVVLVTWSADLGAKSGRHLFPVLFAVLRRRQRCRTWRAIPSQHGIESMEIDSD